MGWLLVTVRQEEQNQLPLLVPVERRESLKKKKRELNDLTY